MPRDMIMMIHDRGPYFLYEMGGVGSLHFEKGVAKSWWDGILHFVLAFRSTIRLGGCLDACACCHVLSRHLLSRHAL